MSSEGSKTWHRLLQRTKPALDFAQRVVDNAHKLGTLCKGQLRPKLLERLGALREAICDVERRLETLSESAKAAEDAAKRVRTECISNDAQTDAYERLRARLDVLGDTKAEPWLCCVVPGAGVDERDEGLQDETDGEMKWSLRDFVDIEEIEKLKSFAETKKEERRKNLENAERAARTRIDIKNSVAKERIQPFLKILLTLAEGAETMNGNEISEGQCFDVWEARANSLIEEQSILIKRLSGGSLGLAELYDHLLHSDGDVDTAVRQLGEMTGKIHTFVDEDGAVTTEDEAFSIDDLVEVVSACDSKFKDGLKRVAASVESMKQLSNKFSEAEKAFKTDVEAYIAQLETEANTELVGGDKLQEECMALTEKVNAANDQFTKLDEFYVKFINAKGEVKGEIRRRWNALAEIENMAQEQQARINKLVEQENAARKSFDEEFGIYLPEGFCPALSVGAEPTNFQYIITNAEDAQNLLASVKRMTPQNQDEEIAS